MSAPLLQIEGLSVRVEDKEILHGIDLQIKKGETHVLMGPNGAGKSTLGYALMGNPINVVADHGIDHQKGHHEGKYNVLKFCFWHRLFSFSLQF